MAVIFGPEGIVFGPARRVEPNRALRPVRGGVSQTLIAGIAAHHHTAFATSPCYRSRATQSPQCMIVSALQSVWSLCKQRGEDGPGDAWQRIEDRRVTLLVLLPRRGLPILLGNWPRELFAEPVELPPGLAELAVDEPYPLDQ